MGRGLFAAFALFSFVAVGQEVSPDYSGPEVLSRAATATPVQSAGNTVPVNYFNLSGFVNGIYDTGLFRQNQNTIPNTPLDLGIGGTEIGGGLTAARRLRRGQFGLDYQGLYRKWPANAFYGGSQHTFNFSYRTAFSKRWTLNYNQNLGYLLNGSVVNFQAPENPGDALFRSFDQRTRTVGSFVSTTYQQTRRLSYTVGGTFFLVRYRTGNLIGSRGLTGFGTASYRIAKRTTLSTGFSYSNFNFTGGAGRTNSNTITFGIQHGFSAKWEVGAAGGMSFTQSQGFISLPLAQLGASVESPLVVGAYNISSNVPYFDFRVIRRWKNQQATGSVGQSVSPGNGFFLSSRAFNITGVYTYSGLRRAHVSGNFFITQFSSITTVQSQSFSSQSAGISSDYRIAKHLVGLARYDFIKYGNFGPNVARNSNRITVGIQINTEPIPFFRAR